MQKSLPQQVPSLALHGPRFLPRWRSHITHWVEQRLARAGRRAAVKSALLAAASYHPDWADVGFDEHFLTHQGAPLMADYYRCGQSPDAAALADAWSNQYGWQPATKRHACDRFLPVAQEFVYVLQSELRQSQSR